MLFNSPIFGLFFLTVFLIYWFPLGKSLKGQNVFLLVSSYVFYGWWDWRFLILIAFTSLTSYLSGLLIERRWRPRTVSALNIVINLGILAYFKYCNFFLDGFHDLMSTLGIPVMDGGPLDIILPVGISFYTFQSLSYSIDVYRGKMPASHNPVRFFAFVSFFPQLVAGPIERASRLLPQFDAPRKFDFDKTLKGFYMLLYGLFLKIVIADRLAVFVDKAWSGIADVSGISATVAVLFFAFQLYIDFWAYSVIAKGVAAMLGFDLMTNFRRPYLSHTFKEFWKRWHISLTSWFMDYVYIPLGGNRKGTARRILNVLVVFLLSGLWHGASWTFVAWGAINALFMLVLDGILRKTGKVPLLNPVMVTCLWALSLVFFRASTFPDALSMLGKLGWGGWENLTSLGLGRPELILSVLLVAGLLIWEDVLEKHTGKVIPWILSRPFGVRLAATLVGIFLIILLGRYGIGNDAAFIYFQF